jgi:hypothetical protein
VRYTGRVPSDPLGKMESEASIFNGSGYQSNSDRWGDYTSMSVDPVDDCTFWYTGQYMAGTGDFVWATRLFSFHFPACPVAQALMPAAPATGRQRAYRILSSQKYLRQTAGSLEVGSGEQSFSARPDPVNRRKK